jgi:hypothetical protein
MAGLCWDRHRLGAEMVEMLAAMHKAEADYNSARFAKAKDEASILKLAAALDAAKLKASIARRNFDDHVHEHQCKQ